jgi:sugar lactone lactonase YvrE
MRNGTALSVIPTSAEPTQGVGRQARTFPHTAAGGNPQDIVANGLAFNHRGDLFVADTARGAIWKVAFDRHGNLKSPDEL